MNYGDPITPRTRRWLRPVALGATLALGVGCVAAISLTKAGVNESRASHHAILGGSASCDDESVTFTVGNSEADKVMTFTSNHGGGTVAASGSTSITVDAQPGSTVTINVDASWPNGVTWSGSHSITVPDNCEPEETTTVPPEPTTTQETVPPSTTSTIPPSTSTLPPDSTSTTSPGSSPTTQPPVPVDTSPSSSTTAPATPPQTSPPATQPEPYCTRFPNAEGCDDGLPTAEGG